MKLKPNVVYTIFRLKGFSFAFNKTGERVEGVPLFLIWKPGLPDLDYHLILFKNEVA